MPTQPLSSEEERNYWIERHKNNINNWRSVGFHNGGERLNSEFYKCRREALLRELHRRNIDMENVRVLDVGCGMGTFSELYHELGADVVGVDISPDAVAYCNRLGIGEFVQSTVTNFPEKIHGKFDIIHCFDVLYHITSESDWLKTFEAFALVSTPTTLWIITEIYSPITYASSQHVVKRSFSTYKNVLKSYNRLVDQVVPIYWLYSLSPYFASKFPALLSSFDRLGFIGKHLLREYAVMIMIRISTRI